MKFNFDFRNHYMVIFMSVQKIQIKKQIYLKIVIIFSMKCFETDFCKRL